MSEIFDLSKLNIGQIGEIVDLEADELQKDFGMGKGMSVIILQKAMHWLVQVGYNQLSLTNDLVEKILVKKAEV